MGKYKSSRRDPRLSWVGTPLSHCRPSVRNANARPSKPKLGKLVARGVPIAPHGVPFDPLRGPHCALHTRRAPPTAARGPVAPPETANQVRTRSTEPHGLHLRPSAGTRGSRAAGRRSTGRAKRGLHTCRARSTAPREGPGRGAKTRQVRMLHHREPRRGRTRRSVTDILGATVSQPAPSPPPGLPPPSSASVASAWPISLIAWPRKLRR